MCTIDFSSGADSLTLRIHGRVKPNAQEYWDANWLHCTVEALVGAFRGTLDWQLRNEDLARFMHALEGLSGRTGEALLDTLDDWLNVRIIRDEQGQIEAQCHLEDSTDDGSTFEFRLFLDQTALPALLGQLREVLERYPVVRREA